MTNVLYIDSAISDNSRTRRICDAYIEKNFQGEEYAVTRLRLSRLDMLPLDDQRLAARILTMKPDNIKETDFTLARQIASADILLVGAPYYDFSFPALLKIYVENIMINGIAFVYDETGIKSLCKAKKLVYITTCGGYIQEGFNFGYEYMCGVCKILGVSSTEFISAQGLDIIGNDADKIVDEAIAQL